MLGWGEEVDDEADIPAHIGEYKKQDNHNDQYAEDDNDTPSSAKAPGSLMYVLFVLIVLFQHFRVDSREME